MAAPTAITARPSQSSGDANRASNSCPAAARSVLNSVTIVTITLVPTGIAGRTETSSSTVGKIAGGGTSVDATGAAFEEVSLTGTVLAFSGAGTFDDNGWLTIGLCGHQPSIGEGYISTGSTYLCATAFLVLGLPATHPFWTDAPTLFTQEKIWSGHDVPADHD